jgi:hypothetical protein
LDCGVSGMPTLPKVCHRLMLVEPLTMFHTKISFVYLMLDSHVWVCVVLGNRLAPAVDKSSVSSA